MDLNDSKKLAKEKLKAMKDSKNIVFMIEKEVNINSEVTYRAYNAFGEEIEGYFCDECIKAHPEQYDFSMFELNSNNEEPQPVRFEPDESSFNGKENL